MPEKTIAEKIEDLLKEKKKPDEEELDLLVEEVLDAYDDGSITRDEAIDLLKKLSELGSDYAEEMLEDLMEEEGVEEYGEELEEEWEIEEEE